MKLGRRILKLGGVDIIETGGILKLGRWILKLEWSTSRKGTISERVTGLFECSRLNDLLSALCIVRVRGERPERIMELPAHELHEGEKCQGASSSKSWGFKFDRCKMYYARHNCATPDGRRGVRAILRKRCSSWGAALDHGTWGTAWLWHARRLRVQTPAASNLIGAI